MGGAILTSPTRRMGVEMALAMGTGSSNAGKAVNADTTLQLSTAWRCIKLKSRVVGALPIGIH